FRKALVRVVDGSPFAAIPDQYGPAAILALRNGALKRVVVDRMILDLDRQPLLARHQARTARHRPALHHAVMLKPQVVMQPARGVLLDHELAALAAPLLAARLGGRVELALGVIGLKAHGST